MLLVLVGFFTLVLLEIINFELKYLQKELGSGEKRIIDPVTLYTQLDLITLELSDKYQHITKWN